MRHVTISVTLSPTRDLERLVSTLNSIVEVLVAKGYSVDLVYFYTGSEDVLMVNGVALKPGGEIEEEVVDVIASYLVTETVYSRWWPREKVAS
ncbi:hypothetical protein [Thermogladius calderae]|uniref:hypothetical protein n=1 Tax=Thermogladius calderae TaxID=1200300 RepID=UPI00064EB384|nr:hypothetical protein [Thermogladius calderae]